MYHSYTAEVDPPDCVIKALACENATKNSMPSTLSSADKNDRITKTPSHDHENIEPNTCTPSSAKIIKTLSHENASESSQPSTLSSTDTKKKVSLISIVAIEIWCFASCHHYNTLVCV